MSVLLSILKLYTYLSLVFVSEYYLTIRRHVNRTHQLIIRVLRILLWNGYHSNVPHNRSTVVFPLISPPHDQ